MSALKTTPEEFVELNNMLSKFARMVDASVNKQDQKGAELTPEKLKFFLTDDCIWEFEGEDSNKSVGVDAIANDFNYFHMSILKLKAATHHYTNRIIETENKKLYWTSNNTWEKWDGSHMLFTGYYDADIIKVDGSWKISNVITRVYIKKNIVILPPASSTNHTVVAAAPAVAAKPPSKIKEKCLR
jgi:hypothetical protein